jgi:PTS system nitrogen regulatory IIA component
LIDFSNCVSAGNIRVLTSNDKFGAIHELIQNTNTFGFCKEVHTFESQVLEREKQQSTGIGKGVAVAHGCMKDAYPVLVALGISKDGIQFQSIDGKPVHLLFLISHAPGKENEYLLTLSGIVKVVRNDEFREKLLQERSPQVVRNMINSAFYSYIKTAAAKMSVDP